MTVETKQKYTDFIKNLYERKIFNSGVSREFKVTSSLIYTLKKFKVISKEAGTKNYRYIGSFPNNELVEKVYNDIIVSQEIYRKGRDLKKSDLTTGITEKQAIHFLKEKGYKIFTTITTSVEV